MRAGWHARKDGCAREEGGIRDRNSKRHSSGRNGGRLVAVRAEYRLRLFPQVCTEGNDVARGGRSTSQKPSSS